VPSVRNEESLRREAIHPLTRINILRGFDARGAAAVGGCSRSDPAPTNVFCAGRAEIQLWVVRVSIPKCHREHTLGELTTSFAQVRDILR
jgi:hypothetical protein